MITQLEITQLDVGFLGITVVWGLVFVAYAANAYIKGKGLQNILWILATLALLAVGATILLENDLMNALGQYHTPIAGMFIPGLFAAGILTAAYKERYGLYWTAYVVLFTLVYIVLKEASPDLTFDPYLLMVLVNHVPSGLIIVIAPAIAAAKGRWALGLTSIGGLLIGVLGLTLATIQGGVTPLLPVDLALDIATPIILLGALFITLGLMLTKQWLGIE